MSYRPHKTYISDNSRLLFDDEYCFFYNNINNNNNKTTNQSYSPNNQITLPFLKNNQLKQPLQSPTMFANSKFFFLAFITLVFSSMFAAAAPASTYSSTPVESSAAAAESTGSVESTEEAASEGLTLLAIPDNRVNAVVNFVQQQGWNVKTLNTGSSNGTSTESDDGVQDKINIGNIFKKIASTILTII